MLKHMTLAEMTTVSGQMVDKTTRRDTFLSIPEVAPLHPLLTTAHNAVLAAQPADTAPAPEMQAILSEETAVDMRHDRLARASSLSLETEREHCLASAEPDEARAAMCDRVQGQLFPEGLAFINTSFSAEAGNAARVEKLLQDQPQIGKFLQTIQVQGKKPGALPGTTVPKTLLDTVSEWIAAGAELKKLEEKREDLVAKQGTPPTIQAARAQWTKVVSAVLANLDLSTAPAEAIEAVRGPILAASDRAEKRYAAEGSAKKAPQESAPAAPPANAKAPPHKEAAPVSAPQ